MPGTDAGSAPQESWHGKHPKVAFAGVKGKHPYELASVLAGQIVQPLLHKHMLGSHTVVPAETLNFQKSLLFSGPGRSADLSHRRHPALRAPYREIDVVAPIVCLAVGCLIFGLKSRAASIGFLE